MQAPNLWGRKWKRDFGQQRAAAAAAKKTETEDRKPRGGGGLGDRRTKEDVWGEREGKGGVEWGAMGGVCVEMDGKLKPTPRA